MTLTRLSAGTTTIPSGIRATRCSKAVTAGAVVVIPAATVNPSGGFVAQRRARPRNKRLRRSARSIRPSSASRLGHFSTIARSRSSETCQCSASSGASAAASASRRGSTSSISSKSSVRARSRAKRSASVLPIALAANDFDEGKQPVQWIDRRRDRLVCVERLECAADALLELRIPDRDQPRQQQPATARPHECLGDGAHRAVVGKQDAAFGEAKGVLAEALDHSCGKCVGERSVRRDGEDGWPFGRPFRHSRVPLSVIGIDLGVPTSNHSPWWTAPKQRPSSIARSHRRLVEKGPSGASRSSRFDIICTPVKTNGATWLLSRRRRRPLRSIWKSPMPL